MSLKSNFNNDILLNEKLNDFEIKSVNLAINGRSVISKYTRFYAPVSKMFIFNIDFEFNGAKLYIYNWSYDKDFNISKLDKMIIAEVSRFKEIFNGTDDLDKGDYIISTCSNYYGFEFEEFNDSLNDDFIADLLVSEFSLKLLEGDGIFGAFAFVIDNCINILNNHIKTH